MKIIFIADLFVEDGILGGGELNNEEFIRIADSAGHDVIKINSKYVKMFNKYVLFDLVRILGSI